jgi:hypothetical protein
MKCQQVREYLEELIDEALPLSVRSEVEKHLTGCGECRAELSELEEIREMISGVARVEPPADFSTAWRQRLDREATLKELDKRKVKSIFSNYRWIPALAAAAVIVVCFGFAFHIGGLGTTSQSGQPPVAVSEKVDKAVGEQFELRISKVGENSKLVQKVLRNFKSSHEGGVTLAYHPQEAEMNVLQGLTWQEANELRKELKKAGAEVVVRKAVK